MEKEPTNLRSAIWATWSLLLGFGILMLGDGLQGTLLPVRADQEGFSTTKTGLIMSSFYVGFLCGSIMAPKIMVQVGHVRVFAALAALASSAILVHAIFIDVWVWILLRLISGFCFAGLYVVAESWLNDRATNETRGKLLSLYMVVTYIGVAIGQLLLNLADPQGYPLFVLTSILISVAVVPLLLSAGESPDHSQSVNISVRDLFSISPLGMVGMFAVGLVTATFFALGPVYAQRQGMNLEQISFYMASAVMGTVILQWPIGALSDRYDRRLVLTTVTLLTSVAGSACVLLGGLSMTYNLLTVALFAGLALPLYSICIAYTNDHLEPNQMIAASGTLVLTGGIGAVLGPTCIAIIMDYAGDDAFYWSMGGVHLATGLFALYRMTRRRTEKDMVQGRTVPTAMHASSSAIEGMQTHARDEAIQADEKASSEGS